MSIYDESPLFRSRDVSLVLVSDGDADDLLLCYSDNRAVKLFNSDNCHGDDFHYTTIEQMKNAVKFWLDSYNRGEFVRMSVVLNDTREVIGTVEMFKRASLDRYNGYGVLRIDLRSDYEDYDIITQLLQLADKYFYDEFEVAHILTKAVPIAEERIQALLDEDFVPLPDLFMDKYEDYYVK